MNLYFRLLYTIFISYWQGKAGHSTTLRLRFRTWLHDLDTNLHMNNGRYLTLMDLGRVQLMIRAGMIPFILRHKWMPVVGESHLWHRRSLAPFQAFDLQTEVIAADEKWIYIQHKFFAGNELMAVGTIKGLFKKPGGTVPQRELFAAMGWPFPTAPVPGMFRYEREK
jgi:acyl-CoA thioesterase FadM